MQAHIGERIGSIGQEGKETAPTPSIYSLAKLREIGLSSRGKALLELYQTAQAPQSLQTLSGDPYSQGLVVHVKSSWSPMRILAAILNPWCQRDSFPWHGKSFRPRSATSGTGFNRLRPWGTTTFPFKMALGPSVIDGKPCVQIDYDFAPNPWFERPVYDELREISPGVFFGPVTRRGKKILCWFGVDVNQQVTFPELG